ncbi:MAG: hypothetical protein QNJ71_04420 [Acidimicrobiia bacterium]|nr:hypothetical protein [Acidimicrobiia bacterium]
MKRAFLSLPGPVPVKVLIAIAIVIVALIVLNFVYEWMGNTFLDSGGGVG